MWFFLLFLIPDGRFRFSTLLGRYRCSRLNLLLQVLTDNLVFWLVTVLLVLQ